MSHAELVGVGGRGRGNGKGKRKGEGEGKSAGKGPGGGIGWIGKGEVVHFVVISPLTAWEEKQRREGGCEEG